MSFAVATKTRVRWLVSRLWSALTIGPMTPEQVRARHWEMLVISAGVIACAFAGRVVQRDRVALWCLPGWPIPQLCLSRALFGVECPGCGLTRSFIYLSQANWQSAWECHRLGWLFAGATLSQIPYRTLCLRTRWKLPSKWTKTISYVLIGLLILNWLIGQAIKFGSSAS